MVWTKENIGTEGLNVEIIATSILLIESNYYFPETWNTTERTFSSTDVWNKDYKSYLKIEDEGIDPAPSAGFIIEDEGTDPAPSAGFIVEA